MVFGFIGSVISSVVGAVCSAVSAVCSGLGAIGSALGDLASKLVPHLSVVIAIIDAVAKICGIFEDERSPEDYGAAMRQAEKKPDDFDSINAYIDYLSEELRSGRININEDKSDTEKFRDVALGSTLAIKGIDEKYKLETGVDFWIGMGQKYEKGKINAEEVKGVLEKAGEHDINAQDLGSYVQNKSLENGSNPSELSGVIKDGLKEAHPDLSDSAIQVKFNELVKNE